VFVNALLTEAIKTYVYPESHSDRFSNAPDLDSASGQIHNNLADRRIYSDSHLINLAIHAVDDPKLTCMYFLVKVK
jgi:hypothetical protein